MDELSLVVLTCDTPSTEDASSSSPCQPPESRKMLEKCLITLVEGGDPITYMYLVNPELSPWSCSQDRGGFMLKKKMLWSTRLLRSQNRGFMRDKDKRMGCSMGRGGSVFNSFFCTAAFDRALAAGDR